SVEICRPRKEQFDGSGETKTPGPPVSRRAERLGGSSDQSTRASLGFAKRWPSDHRSYEKPTHRQSSQTGGVHRDGTADSAVFEKDSGAIPLTQHAAPT